jgi:hypothetical protein
VSAVGAVLLFDNQSLFVVIFKFIFEFLFFELLLLLIFLRVQVFG